MGATTITSTEAQIPIPVARSAIASSVDRPANGVTAEAETVIRVTRITSVRYLEWLTNSIAATIPITRITTGYLDGYTNSITSAEAQTIFPTATSLIGVRAVDERSAAEARTFSIIVMASFAIS